MKDVVDLGTISVGVVCSACGSTDFQTDEETDEANVTCKACGHVAGTYSEVRAAQLAAAKRKGSAEARKAMKKSLKGIKGLKLR